MKKCSLTTALFVFLMTGINPLRAQNMTQAQPEQKDSAVAPAAGTLDYFISQGDNYLKQKDTTNALAVYKKALDLHPNSAAAHHGLGRTYAHLRQYDQAISEMETAIKLDPQIYKKIAPSLIFIYLFKNDIRSAEHLKTLSLIDPTLSANLAKGFFNARIYGLKETAGGLEVFVPLVETSSEKLTEALKDADSLLEQKQYQPAIDAYKKISVGPDINRKEKSFILMIVGTIYFQHLNDIESAIINLNQSVALNPDEKYARICLIDVYRTNQDYPAALAELDKMLAKDPQDKYALYFKGAVSFKAGGWKEAVKNWGNLKRVDPLLFALVQDMYLQALRHSRSQPKL